MIIHRLIQRFILNQFLLQRRYLLDPGWYGVRTDLAASSLELVVCPLVCLGIHELTHSHGHDVFKIYLNVGEKLLHAIAVYFFAIRSSIIHVQRFTTLFINIRGPLIAAIFFGMAQRVKVANSRISVPLGLLEQLDADVVGHLLADDLLHLLDF